MFKTEYITLARQQLLDEYMSSKSQILQTWIVESDKAWREKRAVIPFPTGDRYPTNEDVYRRAMLINEVMEEVKKRLVAESENAKQADSLVPDVTDVSTTQKEEIVHSPPLEEPPPETSPLSEEEPEIVVASEPAKEIPTDAAPKASVVTKSFSQRLHKRNKK